MMRTRILENEGILKAVGATCYNLPFMDRQYPSSRHDASDIAKAVLTHVGADAVFFVPLAEGTLWRHPDHVLVREVGISLFHKGRDVSFYADVPYMSMPRKIRGRYKKHIARRASNSVGTAVSVDVYELPPDERIRKREAMRQYKSQYSMTNIASLGMLGRKANTTWEVVCTPTGHR